ncbi:MAG: hypothetical protein ACLS7Z_11110 [Christensenellales bacterium]
MDRLEQMVQDEENTQIVAAVRAIRSRRRNWKPFEGAPHDRGFCFENQEEKNDET